MSLTEALVTKAWYILEEWTSRPHGRVYIHLSISPQISSKTRYLKSQYVAWCQKLVKMYG